jgi:myo-inositol-1(or 4)-monophosphatase
MSDPDPLALRDLACRVAEEAGALLLGALDGVREVSTKTSPTDVVTEIDRASEELIVRRLLEARPDDAILGEEGGAREGTSGVRWVIDPLDGTVNYLYRIPAFCVAIAAEVGGRAVAGVVHDPSHGDTFAAAEGHGATRNGVPVHPSPADTLATALIGTGFEYRAEVRRVQARVVAEVLPQVRDVRRFGSAALDLCSVACGRLDGYFERGLQPWDSAAATLIVHEAGGVAKQLPDGTWVASGPALFEALHELVASALRSATLENHP